MEKVSDFLKSIQERVVSPLFSSLCISWLVVNWKVTIGILFYTNKELKESGYLDKIGLVKEASNLLPLGLALGFVFFYPVIKNLIKAWIVFMNSKGDTWGLAWSKAKGKIPFHKYYEMKKVLEYQMNAAEKLMADENKYQTENFQLQKTVADLTKEKNEETKRIIRIHELNNSNVMNGRWDVRIVDKRNNSTKDIVYRIQNNSVEIEEGSFEHCGLGTIFSFTYNPSTSFVTMILSEYTLSNEPPPKPIVYYLKFGENIYTITGSIDYDKEIYMMKLL